MVARRSPSANTPPGDLVSGIPLAPTMQDHSARFRAALARHGIRSTRQREEIYAALAASHAHPTAEELLRSVRSSQPGISLATVYNTLETFTKAGLCRKVSTAAAGGPCRYDAELSDHLHAVTPDGRVRDIPEDLGAAVLRHIPAELVRAIEARMGVRVERMTVDFLVAPCPPAPETDGPSAA
jgi:Fe2+ or Zn2+ uptake regulation protein